MKMLHLMKIAERYFRIATQKHVVKTDSKSIVSNLMVKGVCIKYVGGEDERILQNFQKISCSPGDHRPKYSWPSNFFKKYFMAPPINFSFLFNAYL